MGDALGRKKSRSEGVFSIVFHLIWGILIGFGALMIILGATGVINIRTGLYALAVVSLALFGSMVAADRMRAVENPVGMPWIEQTRLVLKNLRGIRRLWRS